MTKFFSPAKINLFLYVESKRTDSFHDIFTLITELKLCDELELNFIRKGFSIECPYHGVPEDRSNLAVRAAELFFDRLRQHGINEGGNWGIDIKIKKRIPPGGGLGGGSSNAACVLKAMNQCYNSPFSDSDLMSMGLELGSDIPFFIHGGRAIAQGTGEKLQPCCCTVVPFHILLIYPGFSASTAAVYKNVDLALTKNRKFNNNALLNICRSDKILNIEGYLHNDLEIAACRLYPEIELFKNKMTDFLHEKIIMTGSGSSFFVLFSDYGKAECAFNSVSANWETLGMTPDRKIFLTSF